MIRTVTGKIDCIARTYIHEHIKIDLSGHKKDPDTKFDDTQQVIIELTQLKKDGISTVVDATNRGMGRDVQVLLQVAEATGLNIIASTGFYKEPFLPSYVYENSDKELQQLLQADIEVGMDGTGAKAHVLGEVGSSRDEITPVEERIFKIVAQVHAETGSPIFTHTTLGTMAKEQVDLLVSRGVDPQKILLGHMDLAAELDCLLQVADKGCYLGFDTIGKTKYQADETRAQRIRELVNRGYEDQIVLSQDLTRKSHLKVNGGIGYDHLYNNFLLRLKDAGVGQDLIDKFLISNPTRLLNI